MNHVVVDSELQAKLSGDVSVRVTDQSGKQMGYFMPDAAFDRLIDAILPEPTAEDIAEARREMLAEGGLSTEEVLDFIKAAEKKWQALKLRSSDVGSG
jgi:hypothetical protein